LPTITVGSSLFLSSYGLMLQMCPPNNPLPEQADPGRRRTLRAIPVASGGVSLGVLALRLLPDWSNAIFNPPEAGLRGVSPEITPIPNFYIVSKNFSAPVVAEA